MVTSTKQNTPFAANVFFALLLAGMSIYFVMWGLDYTNHQQVVLFLVASFFGIFMAFNIGGNDVANSFGTSVGAGTLTVTQALAVAAIFEVSGAVLAGAAVTDTIRSGIVDISDLGVSPNQFIYLMLSALIAAAFWLLFATKRGLPVSTTHAIIGGIVGSSIVLGVNLGGSELALSTVKWSKIGEIALSWVLSPVLGGALSYVIYGLIKKNILAYNDKMELEVKALKSEKKALKARQKEHFEKLSDSEKLPYTTALLRDQEVYKETDSLDELETGYYKELYALENKRDNLDTLKALKTWVPLIAALGAVVMTAMVVFKGLKNTGLNLSTLHSALVMGMIGAMVWLTAFIYTKTIRGKHKEDLGKATFIMFSWMQVFTACAFAFSHGSNDIANAVGPFVAIMDVIRENAIATKATVPAPVLVTFGVSLIVGLWFIGKEVIQTVGTNLTEMHPASGFSAELAAAAVVMGASSLGIPVSSTHILVGAVLGIGLVNKSTNWKLMKPIGLAWVITLPAAGTISAMAFLALSAIFG
ncbi:inorganic phosphate transporter [Moraxella bovis]|uniref:Phosphate transporter n=1 Tax=Moraxella bovis TaxID=476 RepID=A0AAQ2Q0L0_MORBO|nr:inorganic phosphate transporter [Moraxella bovis]AWY20644.1 inorganic phosphate transporter [Moraxella bovis]OOR92506.1 phosphate permease [Moraxella bovis]UYZ69403.1 inorganic phosphate transporter [Moraxella bovis]UYZ71774.1 inorganic phosphate transporter [Moraxella bovis]UYZ72311.1 inorganic phosphate transporter [Moraxella bovis]